jgi:hypothetical protein
MAVRAGQGWPSSGWAKNSGISLSTLDRVDDSLLSPPCIPWIGSGWADDCDVRESTNSWICCGVAVADTGPQPGGGSKRSRIHVPGVTSNRALAMREDEEVVAVLMALLNSRTKN